MKKLIVDGKFPTEMATSWEELTLEQFYRLELWRETKEQNLIEALAILTDIPFAVWNKSSYGDFKNVVLPALSWLSDFPKIRKIRMKDEIEIMGKVIKIPKNAAFETLGQKVAVDQKNAYYYNLYKGDNIRINFYQMTYAMAAYVSPLISGSDFDIEHSEIVQLEIQRMPALEVLPICAFFMKKSADSIDWSKVFQPQRLVPMSLLRIWESLKSLASSKHGMPSQKGTSRNTMKY